MRTQTGFHCRKHILYHGITAIIIAGLILYGTLVLNGEHYYLISLGVIATWLLGTVLSFESGRYGAAYPVCLSVFIVVAVLSRMLLAPFPQVKPIAAVVILSGVCMGSEAGGIVGLMSMFLSNFMFMQGPWTPFQMFGMGLIGYIAGCLFYSKKSFLRIRIAVTVYGFLSVLILYGLIVDINTIYFTLGDHPTVPGIVTVYLAGLPFDLIFALTTAVILFIPGKSVIKTWDRISRKYDFSAS